MKLILLNGHPGAGKSTMAEELRARIPRLAIIDVDLSRKFVSDYNNSTKDIALMWEVVYAIMDVYLRNNISVLIDRCVDTPSDRLLIKQLAEKHSVKFQEIILYTKTLDCAITRVQERPVKKLSRNKKNKMDKSLILSLRKIMLKYRDEEKVVSFDTESNSIEKIVGQIVKIINS